MAKEFIFSQDEQVLIWRRTEFKITADSEEEAIALAKTADNDLEDVGGVYQGSELLTDTEESTGTMEIMYGGENVCNL